MKTVGDSPCTILISKKAAELLGARLSDTPELRFRAMSSGAAENADADGCIFCLPEEEEAAPKAELLRLLLAEAPLSAEQTARYVREGVMVCEPASFERALPLFAAACVHGRRLRIRGESMERRLEDTRLVSRAKLLLMTRLGMTEAQAHRYIEKSAMDTGTKRREVAERILRIYED